MTLNLKEQILQLWNEKTIPENIALKLGIGIDEVLTTIAGCADDERDKRRLIVAEERAYGG